jgi:hypothetical protein
MMKRSEAGFTIGDFVTNYTGGRKEVGLVLKVNQKSVTVVLDNCSKRTWTINDRLILNPRTVKV